MAGFLHVLPSSIQKWQLANGICTLPKKVVNVAFAYFFPFVHILFANRSSVVGFHRQGQCFELYLFFFVIRLVLYISLNSFFSDKILASNL